MGLVGSLTLRATQEKASPRTAPQMMAAMSDVMMPADAAPAGSLVLILATMGNSSPKITHIANIKTIPFVTTLAVGIRSSMAPYMAPSIRPTMIVNTKNTSPAVIVPKPVPPIPGKKPPKTALIFTNRVNAPSPINASISITSPMMKPVIAPAIAPSPMSLPAMRFNLQLSLTIPISMPGKYNRYICRFPIYG